MKPSLFSQVKKDVYIVRRCLQFRKKLYNSGKFWSKCITKVLIVEAVMKNRASDEKLTTHIQNCEWNVADIWCWSGTNVCKRCKSRKRLNVWMLDVSIYLQRLASIEPRVDLEFRLDKSKSRTDRPIDEAHPRRNYMYGEILSLFFRLQLLPYLGTPTATAAKEWCCVLFKTCLYDVKKTTAPLTSWRIIPDSGDSMPPNTNSNANWQKSSTSLLMRDSPSSTFLSNCEMQ